MAQGCWLLLRWMEMSLSAGTTCKTFFVMVCKGEKKNKKDPQISTCISE